MKALETADRQLVERARGGDLSAFNDLASRWDRKVYNYLLRCTGNRDDALDLRQETLLKAFRGLPRLTSPERFPSWLFRIAHNAMASAARKKRPVAAGGDIERLADLPSLPRSRLGRFGLGGAELSYLVEQALASLPAPQREVVVLKIHHGFKFREIAEIAGCPISTVKSRMYAALDALRGLLEPAKSGPAEEDEEVRSRPCRSRETN